MADWPIYILAGGRSARFGSDKARAELDGDPLIVRVASAAAARATRVTVVADRPEKYADLGLTTIADARPGLGPLSGLHSAMADCRAQPAPDPWLICLPCDLVSLKARWLDRLIDSLADDVDVAAYHDDRWHPLIAAYRTDLLPVVEDRLQGKDRSLHGLIEAVRHRAIPPPPDWPKTIQVNTLEDLRTARQSSRQARAE